MKATRRTLLLSGAMAALALVAGCASPGPAGGDVPLVRLPDRSAPVAVAKLASGTLVVSIATATDLAPYQIRYLSRLDWELAEGQLVPADAGIPTLTRTASVQVSASLARSASLYFAPVKPASSYTLTINLKRRDAAGTLETVASGSQASLTIAEGTNAATVSLSPTSAGQLVVSAPQASLPFTPPPSIDALFPATGSVGMRIDVTGTQFGAAVGDNSVAFNGTPATVHAASTTALVAEVPAGATSGPISVAVGGQIGTGAAPFTVVAAGTTLGTHGTGAGPHGVAVDAAGNVWVCNASGTTVSKLAPTGALLATYPAGAAPTGIAFDASGNAWVTNKVWSGTVTRLAPDGTLLGTTGVGPNPQEIAFDGSGNAWVANTGEHSVSKLAATGAIVDTYIFGNGGSKAGGLAVGAAGEIWVCDIPRNTLVKLGATGATIGTYGLSGSTPADVAVDAAGNAWVTMEGSGLVHRVLPSGATDASYTLSGGVAPRFLTSDPLGNLWVCSPATHSVIKLAPGGTVLGTFATGSAPAALAFDRNRAAWVTLSSDNAVRKLAL